MKVKEKVKILKRYVCQLLHPLFSKLFKKQKQVLPPPFLGHLGTQNRLPCVIYKGQGRLSISMNR